MTAKDWPIGPRIASTAPSAAVAPVDCVDGVTRDRAALYNWLHRRPVAEHSPTTAPSQLWLTTNFRALNPPSPLRISASVAHSSQLAPFPSEQRLTIVPIPNNFPLCGIHQTMHKGWSTHPQGGEFGVRSASEND